MKPIIFSGPMVRAILEGRKTQTRRVVKPQPEGEPASLTGWARGLAQSFPGPAPATVEAIAAKAERLRGHVFPFRRPGSNRLYSPTCPFGAPGGKLWVRETFAINAVTSVGVRVNYMADDRMVVFDSLDADAHKWADKYERRGPRPSIFMPRWASRIKLAVKSIRVERLNEISEHDALAEGIVELEQGPPNERYWALDGESGHHSARNAFIELWESIHGKGAWDTNPWVWVVEFEVAQ